MFQNVHVPKSEYSGQVWLYARHIMELMFFEIVCCLTRSAGQSSLLLETYRILQISNLLNPTPME